MKLKWTSLLRGCLLCIGLFTAAFTWIYTHNQAWNITAFKTSLVTNNQSMKTVCCNSVTEVQSVTTNHTEVLSLLTPTESTKAQNGVVSEYHREELNQCKLRISNKRGINWCQCVPPNLLGRIPVNMEDENDWDSIRDLVGVDVLAGGEWKPIRCISHTRLAIIIPCRDRESHLRIFLRHIYPILKRQLVHFRIFVVDQRYPAIFNKAALMNIGFLEAKKVFDFNCVVFHDVDMLLEDDRTLMTCGPEPRHYASSVSRFGYGRYSTFGGVTSIEPELFQKVNGFPLRYFGWGGEDDEMWSRVSRFSKMYRLPSLIARYSTIPHKRDATNLQNSKRHALIREATKSAENHAFEGLSDLSYEVNDVQVEHLLTRIEADINTTGLQYPKRQSIQYITVWGACQNSSYVTTLPGVEWTSCRFVCDTSSAESCLGFSYFNSTCFIINAACDFSPVRNVKTYIRTWRIKESQ